MGKASKWFRGLLGLKKADANTPSRSDPKPPKRRWSFVKSYREKDHHNTNVDDETIHPNKHAIAVAAATAAVADAAVKAAHAAAAVVKLTSTARSTSNASANTAAHVSIAALGIREQWAAVKIQSNFRAYLSRRALRALKALVKLQALVRGHIVRKQTEDVQQRLQALLRAQSRARAGRARISESSHSSTKSSHFHHPGPATPEKFEYAIRAKSTKTDQPSPLKRNGSRSNCRLAIDQEKSLTDEGSWERGCSTRTGPTDDEKSDKILEIDTGKPPHHLTPKRRNLFHSSHHTSASDQNSHSLTSKETAPSPSSCEVQSFCQLNFTPDPEETSFCTADNSPQFYSASSKGGSSMRGSLNFTPTKSDGSRSCLSGYPDHPNFMAYTESSKAKIRSMSAPRQRPGFEKPSAPNRYLVYGELRSSSRQRAASAMQASFTSKAYPGSGRLDRLGMPVGADMIGFSGGGGHWNRY